MFLYRLLCEEEGDTDQEVYSDTFEPTELTYMSHAERVCLYIITVTLSLWMTCIKFCLGSSLVFIYLSHYLFTIAILPDMYFHHLKPFPNTPF